jgi:hypothetical protein
MAKTILLDTDIDSDCDDTGALAILHALATEGSILIAGVVCSIPVNACARAAMAINSWYGRPDDQ